MIPQVLLPKSRSILDDLSNEYRLLLACARPNLTAPQIEQAHSAIAGGVDWDLLDRHANRHGLSPLLSRNLQLHFPLEVPDPQQQREKSFQHNVGNLFLAGALLKILDALRASGIRALAYKGPALAALLYGNITLREMSDLDILIEPGSISAARNLLIEQGYQPAFTLTRKQEEACLSSDCESEFSDGKVAVDLHWRITPPHLAPRFSFDTLWQRRRDVTIGQNVVPTFSSEDTALVLAVHGGKHLWPRLSWLADFAQSLQLNLNWPSIGARAREARAGRMLLLALALAHDIFQVQISTEFSTAIEDDKTVQNIAGHIAKSFFADYESNVADHSSVRWAALFQLADSRCDGFRSAARFAFNSGPREWQATRLPDSFFSFYRVLRIAALLRNTPAVLFSALRAR
jgi:hypothetical protein